MESERKAMRQPILLKIKFKCGSLAQFIERYSVDISRSGIFIRTKEPLKVGTAIRFEFQLQDASPLIAGGGTVLWTRDFDPKRTSLAPGMGVRFDKLTGTSQQVLDQILAEKARRGEGLAESRYDVGARASQMVSGQVERDATPLPPPMPGLADDPHGFSGQESTRVMEEEQARALADQSREDAWGDQETVANRSATEVLARKSALVTPLQIPSPVQPPRETGRPMAITPSPAPFEAAPIPVSPSSPLVTTPSPDAARPIGRISVPARPERGEEGLALSEAPGAAPRAGTEAATMMADVGGGAIDGYARTVAPGMGPTAGVHKPTAPWHPTAPLPDAAAQQATLHVEPTPPMVPAVTGPRPVVGVVQRTPPVVPGVQPIHATPALGPEPVPRSITSTAPVRALPGAKRRWLPLLFAAAGFLLVGGAGVAWITMRKSAPPPVVAAPVEAEPARGEKKVAAPAEKPAPLVEKPPAPVEVEAAAPVEKPAPPVEKPAPVEKRAVVEKPAAPVEKPAPPAEKKVAAGKPATPVRPVAVTSAPRPSPEPRRAAVASRPVARRTVEKAEPPPPAKARPEKPENSDTVPAEDETLKVPAWMKGRK